MRKALLVRHSWFGALAVAVLLAGGCTTPVYTDYDAFMKYPRPIVGGKPYVIEPPDAIQITAPNAPEIHGVRAQLRPDGYITLFLLGDVFAAGKTPTQLASEIEEKILKYYQDVTVQVQVVGFNSKRYYMAGETSAGIRSYTGRDTLLDAVIGGIGRTSWPEKAVMIRPNEQGELVRRMSVNLKEMIETGDLKYNAVIEEGDIIFIPINPVAAIGVFVQNLLAPIDPALRVVSTPARVGSTVNYAENSLNGQNGYGGGRYGGGYGY
jgi:polysaccharide biosynthesis/export protein